MKRIAILCSMLLGLVPLVGGCVADGLGPKTSSSPDLDNPKQVCEHTMIGSEPKTVCY